MAKHRGINTRVLIDGYDFSNYFKTFQGDAMVNALDATGFLATNKEYLVDGFQDGKVSLEGFYARDQETPDQVDNILRSALGSATKKVVTIAPVNSDTLGNYCFLVSADQSKLTFIGIGVGRHPAAGRGSDCYRQRNCRGQRRGHKQWRRGPSPRYRRVRHDADPERKDSAQR
jgi:hypothetical protein